MLTIRCFAVVAACLLIVPAASAAVPLPAPLFPGVRSVLWVAAHPDDEVLAAPLLGRLCRGEDLKCTLLVFTRGEKGACALPGGCGPDLGRVREEEMRRAARLFGAELVQWRLADGGGVADPTPSWADASGGHAGLVRRVREAIDEVAPDLVLTFDPRHGTTCHPDHKAVARLVTAALEGETRPAVYLLETVLERANGLPARFRPAALAGEGVIGLDAATLDETGQPLWGLLLQDVAVHRSQFSAAARAALRRFPPRQRVVFFGHGATLLASEQVHTCP